MDNYDILVIFWMFASVKENRSFPKLSLCISKLQWKLCSFVLLLLTVISLFYWFLKVHRLGGVSELIVASSHLSSSLSSPSHCQPTSRNSTQHRCLPNTFIIGASKAGTTSLVSFLKEIPSVYFVSRGINPTDHHTEVHRFDRSSYKYANKRLELAHEWASSPIVNDSKSSLIVHYTPHYLYAPTVPFEMKDFYTHSKQLKFIILLRDPVERTISSYWFKNSHLFKRKDGGSVEDFLYQVSREQKQRQVFEQCMLGRQDEPVDIIAKEIRSHYLHHIRSMFETNISNLHYSESVSQASFNWSMPRFCTFHKGLQSSTTIKAQQQAYFKVLNRCFGNRFRSPSLGLRHIDKSVYIDQMIRWLVNFNQHQFLIITTEELKLLPVDTLDKIMTFVLGENKKVTKEQLRRINFSEKSRLVQPNKLAENPVNRMNISILNMLRAYYEDYDRALFELLVCHSS